MRGARILGALVGVLLAGCGDDGGRAEFRGIPEPPPVPGAPEGEPGPEGEAGDDPLEGLEGPADPSEVVAGHVVPASVDTLAEATPERGCVVATQTPARVWPSAAPVTIVSQGDGFVVAGHARRAEGGTELFLVGISPERPPVPLRTLPVDPPGQEVERVAAPGLAVVDPTHLYVAFVGRDGKVRAGEVPANDPRAQVHLGELGEGADLRFAPAVTVLGGRRLIAWTDGSGSPMRVKLAVVRGRRAEATVDVTPESMGASAPTFGEGMTPPVLYFVDARAGVSPILRVPIGANGRPGEAQVAHPVGTVTTPPRLAVAGGGGAVFAGYTVVGNAATTAVGWVRVDGQGGEPAAIVPGTGYGALHVDAVSGPRAAVFAADAPRGPEGTAPREVHLRTIRPEGGAGPVLAIRGPDETGSNAAIARRGDGLLAVAFVSGSGVHVAWARCDD